MRRTFADGMGEASKDSRPLVREKQKFRLLSAEIGYHLWHCSTKSQGLWIVYWYMVRINQNSGAHIRGVRHPLIISESVQNFYWLGKFGPRKIMHSVGQSVQKYFHATVCPERVYTRKQNVNVRPWRNGYVQWLICLSSFHQTQLNIITKITTLAYSRHRPQERLQWFLINTPAILLTRQSGLKVLQAVLYLSTQARQRKRESHPRFQVVLSKNISAI